MGTFNYVLSQILVIIAIGLYAFTFLLKTKKNILIFGLIGVVLNTISFVLLGAYTGAVVNLVAMVRSLWFFIEEKRGKRTWVSLTVVMILIIVATVFTYQNLIDLLPLIAGLTYAYTCWQKNVVLYRWSGVLVSVIYIVYDIYFKSIFGVVSESFAITCAVVGLIMGFIKNKKTTAGDNVVADRLNEPIVNE